MSPTKFQIKPLVAYIWGDQDNRTKALQTELRLEAWPTKGKE